MDPNKPVKISISGKLSYDDEITLNQAAQIIAFIDNSSNIDAGAAASLTRLAPAQIAVVSTRSGSNPRDVLDASGAKTNPEKIVAFASSVLDEGKDTFTLEDIKPLFRRARESTPANLSRDLDSAIRSNWVAEADVKGEFYITNKGSAALEGGFKEKALRSSSGVKPKAGTSRKTKKANVVPEAFNGVDPIPSTLSDAPNYSALKSQKDRLIWLVAMAKGQGIEGLSNQDVAWVSDYLGTGIPSDNVAKAFIDARKVSAVNRSTLNNKIRITDDGIAYLSALANKKSD